MFAHFTSHRRKFIRVIEDTLLLSQMSIKRGNHFTLGGPSDVCRFVYTITPKKIRHTDFEYLKFCLSYPFPMT